MLIGVAAGTITMALTKGLDLTPLAQPLSLVFSAPKFNLSASLTIGLLSIAVMFEMMGDTKNTSDIIGLDVFKEVGVGRISLGNGLATILGGLGSSNAYTTYSENSAFVMLSKYFNPMAQVFTGIFFITVAFITPVSKLILCLPMEAFGGVVVYLFSMIMVNSMKQLFNSGIDLNKDRKEFVIIIIMIGIAALEYVISGISISSVAIATLVGVILNALMPKAQ